MRYEDDINKPQQVEINMPGALLKDNAPDSELYLTRVRVQLGAAIFDFYTIIYFKKFLQKKNNNIAI